MTNKLTLDVIKQMIADGVLKQNIAEEYFPELKESEDERIRRMLREIVLQWKNGHQAWCSDDKEIDTILAWLKKQGEQNLANKEYTFKAIPRLLEMIQPTDRAKSYCQKLIDSLEQEGYITDAKIVSDCLKQMNGEKVAMATMDEQKPAWSEEDEEIFSYLEDVVDFCYRNQYVVDVQTCERVRQLVFRLKSLCFQSKWSKDDITQINEIIETLNIVQANRVRTQRMHYNKATIDKNIDWLKSLKDRLQSQPKQ